MPITTSFPTDLEIAQAAKMKPIADIATRLGISTELLEPYGRYKAKLPLSLISEERMRNSNLILVTAITPTPAGEGKTTSSIALVEGLNRIGKQAIAVLREPSLGPVFGMKGGAAGGGYAQVVPMEDINLHFTGDFSAVEKAHNLLTALIDNNIQDNKRSLGIDPRTVTWKRVMDMNDRALRNIIVGLGGKSGGIPRESGFDITAASEVMAILCMATSREDLKKRLGDIYIGDTFERKPVFARDLHADGAMAILLKDAIMPNLVQTLEGNPAILHGGPFANIAQGTNTILATRMGMSLADYVVTEAGFGADLGAEKFLDIKCRTAGLSPKAVVIVATVRALKYHGGMPLANLKTPDTDALERGICNLEKHLENIHTFGLPVVVAINRFHTDSEAELRILTDRVQAKGASIALNEGFIRGGAGAESLARAVITAVETCTSAFKPAYQLEQTVQDKIIAVAKTIYGAGEIVFQAQAQTDLKRIERLGLNNLPICMAKTQYSFSDNPKLLGRPSGFTLSIRTVEIAAGAGFLIPITGEMLRMPGLPSVPAAEGMDIDAQGRITGLS